MVLIALLVVAALFIVSSACYGIVRYIVENP